MFCVFIDIGQSIINKWDCTTITKYSQPLHNKQIATYNHKYNICFKCKITTETSKPFSHIAA